MKKPFALFVILAFALSYAQTTANVFFYELSFKPKKYSDRQRKL